MQLVGPLQLDVIEMPLHAYASVRRCIRASTAESEARRSLRPHHAALFRLKAGRICVKGSLVIIKILLCSWSLVQDGSIE